MNKKLQKGRSDRGATYAQYLNRSVFLSFDAKILNCQNSNIVRQNSNIFYVANTV